MARETGVPDDDSISALLPVHRAVDPEHLEEALASLRGQTRAPDEVVVVEDGPLDERHLELLDRFEQEVAGVVRVRLEHNGGAGVANGSGLRRCTGTWVAKVDADDISAPDRLERQLAAVRGADLDLCGSAMAEFEDSTGRPTRLRAMPATHDEIAARLPYNNPINHPTAFFRRSVAVACGGYPDMRFMQDYVLFARMVAAGARSGNLPDPLVRFRTGPQVATRRRDPRLTPLELELRRELRRLGMAGAVSSWLVTVARLAYRHLPAWAMRVADRRVASPAPRGGSAGPPPRRVDAATVRWQLRLGGRTLRTIVRRPSVARELPRLLATRGRSTMSLRMPWLPFRLVDELAGRVGPGTRVFEYGGGGSTCWYLDRGAEVVTVEHHAEWADVLERSVPPGRWTLLRRSSEDAYAAYVAAIDDYPDGHFDVVVVDGRERARCLLAAVAKVRPGGLLLLDDSDRERYRGAAARVPWPRREIVGFAPAKPTLAYTTAFDRPSS